MNFSDPDHLLSDIIYIYILKFLIAKSCLDVNLVLYSTNWPTEGNNSCNFKTLNSILLCNSRYRELLKPWRTTLRLYQTTPPGQYQKHTQPLKTRQVGMLFLLSPTLPSNVLGHPRKSCIWQRNSSDRSGILNYLQVFIPL